MVKDGYTALIGAAHNGHLLCIQYLISQQANVSQRDKVRKRYLGVLCIPGLILLRVRRFKKL